MLQLNHVTVTRGQKEILSDCTFQFQEGKVYVIVSSDSEDLRAFLKCVCKEKATKRGEIITWDGSTIYNALDDMFLPRHLTVKEYLENLVNVSGNLTTAGSIMKRLKLDDRHTGKVIGLLPEEEQSLIRLAPVYATHPYIVCYGDPFPETDIFCEIINDLKEEKVFILATTDMDEARKTVAGTEGILLSCETGEFKPLSIGDI